MISTKINPKFIAHPLEMIEAQFRTHAYSSQTVKAYLGQLKSFFIHIKPKPPHKATDEDLQKYLDYLNQTNKSRSTIDQTVNALRFLWEENLGRNFPIENISRPLKKERQPVLLTLEEVHQIAMASVNPKHRLMIELAYSAGLRISELVIIRIRDVNLQNNNLFVCGTKKKPKGRITIFSSSLKDEIIRQIGKNKPDDFLFPSERGGRLTTRAFAKYFKAALEFSGIGKAATPHSLRHSFAAFLLKEGTTVHTVQNLLGHVRRESTIFYTKLAQPRSGSTTSAQTI